MIGTVAQAAVSHFVDAAVDTVDCDTFDGGIDPGDTIILAAGSRGPLTIRDCLGTGAEPIVIRNDTTGSGPTIIQRTTDTTGGFVFNCRSCEHVVLDGTGKWSGAPAGSCGVSSWPGALGRTQCGIKVTATAGGPSSFVRFGGSSKRVTIRGVEVDGAWPAATTNGIGIAVNDHNYNLPDHPGEWREDVVIEHNYIHHTEGEGIYFGPNYNADGADDLKLRNNEIRYNLVEDNGYDCISMKSTVEGFNRMHHNFVARCGLTFDPPSTGNSGAGIDFFEGGGSMYNNWVQDVYGSCYVLNTLNLPASDYGPLAAEIYNNVAVRCGTPDNGKNGINVHRKDASVAEIQPTIYNNTIVSPDNMGIGVASAISTCTVRDNLIADAGGSELSVGSCTSTNNLAGSTASMDFVDSSADDYHLRESSPARNTGTSAAPATDHDDLPRPQEGTDDVGAYEYVGECLSDGSCTGTCGENGVDNCGVACTSGTNCDPGCPDATRCDLCGNPACGAGGAGGGAGSSSAAQDDPGASGACGCHQGTSSAAGPPLGWLLALAAVIRLRRRR